MKLSERLNALATELEAQGIALETLAANHGLQARSQLPEQAATLREAAAVITALDPRENFELLNGATHLVLYFANKADADGFSAMVRAAMPSLKTHRFP